MTEGPYAATVIMVLFVLASMLAAWQNAAAAWGWWFPW